MFDINKFKRVANKDIRYKRQLQRVTNKGLSTDYIKSAVKNAIENLDSGRTRSFVIYGEPQSGKTEMMIALTARLLDEGNKIIVVLLNDSLQLLTQNLERFKRSGLDPTPKIFAELLDSSIEIGNHEWVIFCKKNARDLEKLNQKLRSSARIVVIDDEADYATPNAKINRGHITRINELILSLLGDSGIYIGVTATPARLDLNNTFNNTNEYWIDFSPHQNYVGQDTFFPVEDFDLKRLPFRLCLLPDQGDDPIHLRKALFRFFINAAYLNIKVNDKEDNYSILIHTSGKKVDHTKDYKVVIDTINVLKGNSSRKYENHVRSIWSISKEVYPGSEDVITQYIVENISRYAIVVMNSDFDKRSADFKSATSPSALFTIAIGGNIVSRGVTFDNLLSMFFTRDVKNKIQQDTYIQRARMFGSRGKYLEYFELCITGNLYSDWHRCFLFHKLALTAIRKGNGSPVWIEDRRVSAVAASSIDRTTVDLDKGEMGFEMFDYDPSIEDIIHSKDNSFEKLKRLRSVLGDNKLPQYVVDYIISFSPSNYQSIAIHNSKGISGYQDADQVKIERKKSFMGKSDLEENKYPHAVHHLKIYFNDKRKGRVFYKYAGDIRFLKNLKGFAHN